ncbi:MAG: hypothetical protein ACI9TF_001607 [Paracrocinitomix sp.]
MEHMAAVFDIDHGFRSRAVASVDTGLEIIEIAVSTLGPTDAVAQLQRAQRRLASFETRVLAEHITSDGNTRQAEKLLRDSKSSRGSKNKKLGRAKVVGKNASLGDKLADDELSEEQLDLIADASSKSNGAAAVDAALIEQISHADPDAGRSIKDDWLANRATAGGTQSEHERQRALRRTQSFTSKKSGLDVTKVEGDGVSQQAIQDAIRARSKEIFQRDGGRDLGSAHPRTRTQREYDATYELICGVTTRPDGSHYKGDAASASPTAGSRPRIVVGLTVDGFIGNDPAQVARQIGLGVIPASVVADYAEHADIFAALFDRQGEPLWLSRMHRNATATQYVALVLRDRCCVQCGAAASECDVHHRMPWHAPGKGATDLDNLALLCRSCHTRLHAEQLTLYRDPVNRHWRTRAATPDELPPQRRTHPPPQRE